MTATELPGLTSLSRLFGVTLKVSCAPGIVALPVLVSVTVNEVRSPRSIEDGPDSATEPCGDVPLVTVTVRVAVAVPPLPVAVRL